MKLTTSYRISGFQMQGHRSYQEDRFLALNRTLFGKKISLLAIADGMGGHNAGDIAAEIAIRETKNFFDELNTYLIGDLKKGLEGVFYKANTSIRNYSSNHENTSGMGTTLTCALIVNDKMLVAHIGDSRAYIVSESGAHQCTKDHSAYQEALDSGIDVSKISVGSNAITRCLDGNKDYAPDFSAIYDINRSLVFVSSDGFHETVNEDEIEKIAAYSESADEFAKRAVERAIAKKSKDNVTVSALTLPGRKVLRLKGFKRKRRQKTAAKVMVSIATLLLMVTIGYGIWGDQLFDSDQVAVQINSSSDIAGQGVNNHEDINHIIDHTDQAERQSESSSEGSGDMANISDENEATEEDPEESKEEKILITFNTGISNVSFTEAHIEVETINTNDTLVLSQGVCWDTESVPSEDEHCIEIESEDASYISDITNLKPGTTYFYRPYLQLSDQDDKIWGEVDSFTTNRLFEDLRAESISDTSVTITGRINDFENISSFDLCYATEENVNPARETDTCVKVETQDGHEFSNNVENLLPSTQYFVNVFTTLSGQDISFDEISFTTEDIPQTMPPEFDDENFGLGNSIIAELNEIAYCIQVSAFDEFDSAEEYYSEVLNKNFRVQILDSGENDARYKVCTGQFQTSDSAMSERDDPDFQLPQDGQIRRINNFEILK